METFSTQLKNHKPSLPLTLLENWLELATYNSHAR